MSILRVLSNVSIREQILIGYFPVLLIVAFVALSSYTSFNKFEADFRDLAEVTRENILFVEIEKDVMELQRNVLVYSYVGYKGVLRKIEFLQDTIEEKFEVIRPIAQKNPDVGKRFDRIVEHYEDYNTGFSAAIKERAALENLYKNELEPLIEKSHDLLALIMADFEKKQHVHHVHTLYHAEQNLLKANINIRSFSASPDASLIAQTNEILSNIIRDFEGFRDKNPNLKNKDRINEFLESLGQYKSTSQKILNANRTYLHLANVVLAGKAAEIDTLATELDALSAERTQFFQSKIEQDIQASRQSYIFLSIFASILGLVCSMLVARGIAKPVTSMALTLSKLSQENLDVTIPGQQRKDEVGQMAKAAHGFQKMAFRVNQQGEQIQESEAKLSLIVNNMADGLMTMDDHGVIESCNHAFETIFGYTANQMIGKNVKTLMPDTQHDGFDAYIKEFNQRGGSHVIGAKEKQIIGVRKNKAAFPMEISISQTELNNRILYSAIIRDITQRKTAELALLRANAELEEFAYRTSHDLRSPLISSISLLSLVETSLKDGDTDLALKSVGFVSGSLMKLEALVKDILALAEATHGQEESQDIDFQSIVHDALEKLDHMDNFDRLEIETEFKYSSLKAPVNRVVLIVENLISNAIKYQDPSKENSFVKVSVHDRAGGIRLSVEDNGLGISEEFQEQLFTMFKRFHPKTAFGSGLGLYMMKKSVDMIGGEISYEHTGDGSRFNVDFIDQA